MAGFAEVGRLVATLGLNSTPFVAGMNKAKSKMADFTKASMIVGRAMTRFVTLPMALAGGAAVSMQAKFEASMTKIIGLVGVSRTQVEKWNKEVLAMSRATGRGPEELADALFFVTSAGLRGADAMNVLEVSAKAAASGLGETKVIADLVTSAMNAYGKENLSAAQATDILVAAVREGKAEADELAGAMGMVLPIASEYGVTFDQVGAAFAGMTRTGTNARVAATQLKAILSAMASPSSQAADAMGEFGLSAEGFRKTVREQGLIQALLDLRAATEGNEDALAGIFPNIRALMGTLDLLGKNVEFNVQIFEALANAGGSLNRAFEEVQGTTQQKLNVAMATLRTTLIEVGNLLKGPLVTALSGVNDHFNKLTKGIQLMTDQQKKFTLVTMAATAAIGPFLLILSKVFQVAMLNPFTAVAIALGVLIGVLVKYGSSIETVHKIQKRTKKQQEDIFKNAHKEMFVVQKLAHTLKTTTKGTEEWNEAKNKVNATYGDYLDNIITEKMSQDELAESLNKVAKARFNEVAAMRLSDEATRVMDEYINNFTESTKRWSKLVDNNAKELLEKTGKTPAEFSAALFNVIEEANTMLEKGDSMGTARDFLYASADEIYGTYIEALDSAPKRRNFKENFMTNLFSNLRLRKGSGDEVRKMNVMIADMTKDLGGGNGVEIDIKAKIGKIDADINYIKATSAEMSKQESLLALISLHKKKNAHLSEEEQKANNLIISDLNKELRIQKKLESTLGSEAKAEALIDKLKRARKKLSGGALADNSKALANAKRELEILQIQSSELSKHQKFGAMIKIDEERLKTLSGEALETATKKMQVDKLSHALQASKNSGLNVEQKLLLDIAAYKEYGLSLDEDSREANEAIVLALEKRAKAEAQRYSDANKLGKLQMDLRDLEEDAAKLDGDKALAKQNDIRLKEKEIALEEEFLAGLNDIAKSENKIARMKEDNSRLKDADLEANKQAILAEELHLINLKKEQGALTVIEQQQLDILRIQLLQLQATDPAKAIALRQELEAAQAQLDNMRGGSGGGTEFAIQGSGAWFKAMKEKIAMQKNARATQGEKFGEDSDEYKIADAALRDSLGEKLNAYGEYFSTVLSAASTFTNAMTGLFEAQKQRELSAAGDNAKKREAIEKKYHQKQKRWALAEALINTAAAAVVALRNKNPIHKWIDFAAVLAAGSLQTAAISAQSFATGGIVSGPTLGLMGEYPGAKSNPEVIAPLSKLKDLLGRGRNNGRPQLVELRLRGRDAVAMVDIERLVQNSY